MKLFLLALLGWGVQTLLLAQQTDAQGRKQGVWAKYDPASGDLAYRGQFVDDRPVGTFTYYYSGAQTKALLTYKLEGKIIYAQLFHPEGSLMASGKYVGREIRDSIWNFYDINGRKISTETYRFGVKHGLQVIYLPDGSKSREVIYRSDTLNGPVTEYLDGVQVKFKGHYRQGLLDGDATYYRTDGSIASNGSYKKGQREGFWLRYDKTNKSPKKEFYLNGQLLSDKDTKNYFELLKKSKPLKPASKKPAQAPRASHK